MVFIGLYSVATALLFINFEPLKTIGVFLSICYLPGLSFFAFAKRDKIIFEDLLLAFPCSIGISSAFSLIILFSGIQVAYIPIIIHLIISLAVVWYILTKYRQKAYAAVKINKQQVIFCLFAFLVTLLFSIPFFLGLDRMGIAGHAFHHSLMATQILNGIFPPKNPGLGGESIGYYWGFHSLVAAITSQTNLHPLQIMFILNLSSLYLIFCITYCFARAYNLSELYCYVFPMAVIGLMRSDAGILFLAKYFSGKLPSLKEISSPVVESYDFIDRWLHEIPRFDSRLLYLRKFYNVSGMPLAISLCYAYFLLLKLTLKKESSDSKFYFICAGIVIAACVFTYPPLAIFLLLYAPVWSCVVFLSSKENMYERLRELLKTALPYIAACLIVAPYILFIMKSRSVSSSGQGEIFSFDFYDQSIKNIVVFLVPLPLIIWGAWLAFKRLSFSRDLYLLFICTALGLILSIFTRWPFNNSYKFNYALTFSFSFYFVLALSRWVYLISSRWLKFLLIAFVFFFLALNPILNEASYLAADAFTEYKYFFNGRHILYAKDVQRNEAYAWIRENTPPNSLLMLSYIKTAWPCCGYNTNYERAAMTERALYAIEDEDYTVSDPEYSKRILFREKLFQNPESQSVADYFSMLNRPVYLLIEDSLDETTYLVENRFKHFPEDPGKEFALVFHNGRQRVYHIQLKKSFPLQIKGQDRIR